MELFPRSPVWKSGLGGEGIMRICITIGVALCCLFLPVRLAYACECPMRIPAIDALADSYTVFVGTVTHVRPPQPSFRLTRNFPFIIYDTPAYTPLTITLAVSQIWRGPPYRTITLATGSYFQCGVPFQVGREYLVYAYHNAVGDLTTHRCHALYRLHRPVAILHCLVLGIRQHRILPLNKHPPRDCWPGCAA